MSAKWLRVTKQSRCVACGKPDWCTICPEIGLACCMRVESPRPCRNGGWLHPLNAEIKHPIRSEPIRPTINAPRLAREWYDRTRTAAYEQLAGLLSVSVESLRALRCGWATEHHAWCWPMRNGSGLIVGIRLRTADGRKFSVPGSREGVFLPATSPATTAWLPEGPTDCAALLTLGKFAIGRPSCSGGIAHLSATIARLGIRRAVILADNDADKCRPDGQRYNPGLDGAQRLARDIGVPCALVLLPTKDVRDALRLGMTPDLLDSMVAGLVWKLP